VMVDVVLKVVGHIPLPVSSRAEAMSIAERQVRTGLHPMVNGETIGKGTDMRSYPSCHPNVGFVPDSLGPVCLRRTGSVGSSISSGAQ
jgi:hypothetical protein